MVVATSEETKEDDKKYLAVIDFRAFIETKEQYDQLQAMGCQMYQGYFFAKPMPLEDFEKQFGAAG